MPCTYEIVREPRRFLAISDAWRDLWQRSGAGIFQCHTWIAAGWSGDLNIGLAWENERLLAVLPLAIRRRSGLRVLEWAGQQFSDYCDGIAESQHSVLLQYLWDRTYMAGGFDLIWLKQMTTDAKFQPLDKLWPTKDICLQLCNRGQWTSGEAWFRSLNKKARNDHLRGRRILEQQGRLVFRQATGAEIDAILDWSVSHKQDWVKRNRLHSTLLEANALHGLVRALESLGALRLFVLECDGQLAAVSVNIVQHHTMLAFFATYDPTYERGSPGIILMTEYTKWAFDNDIRVIDYLRGEEAYKFKFATTAVETSSFLAAKTLPGKLALTVYRMKNGHQTPVRPTIGSAYRTPSGQLRRSAVTNP